MTKLQLEHGKNDYGESFITPIVGLHSRLPTGMHKKYLGIVCKLTQRKLG